MKYFCLTLTMPNDEPLIQEYIERHRAVWPEVLQSFVTAGVINMELYRKDNLMVMLLVTEDDFTFERKAQLDLSNPIVMQWEAQMAKYQGADPTTDASARWKPLELFFSMQDQIKGLL